MDNEISSAISFLQAHGFVVSLPGHTVSYRSDDPNWAIKKITSGILVDAAKHSLILRASSIAIEKGLVSQRDVERIYHRPEDVFVYQS